MITRFRVQNYKALRDVTLNLTPVHVLIGPNDSGKTSLLEALAALCRSVEHPIDNIFRGGRENRNLLYRQKQSDLIFEARFEEAEGVFDGYRVSFDLFGDWMMQIPSLREEDLLLTQGGSTQLPGSELGVTYLYRHREDRLTEADVTDVTQQIAYRMRGVHFYRFSPEALKIPVVLDAGRHGRMEFNGFGLPQLLDEIRNDREQYTELEKRFTELFPHVEAIELPVLPAYAASPLDHRQVQRSDFASGKGIQFRLTNDGMKLPAENASDGMMFVLAYLALLYLPEPPRVLLIEEPENGIHPALLKEIIRILKQLVSEQTHTQVLMTTHSPYVLHEFTPEEVTVCVREKNGEVKTRRLSESKAVQEQMDFFSLGEIWTMEGDEALIQPATDENLDEATPAPPTEVQPAP